MQEELVGTPRPHYLESVEEISLDGQHLKGVVFFPSTDRSIADRVDHVNAAHHLFALWNAAHLMCKRAGINTPLALDTRVKSYRRTSPDKLVTIDATATIEREDGNKVYGVIRATFTDHKKLCEVESKFVAQRAT